MLETVGTAAHCEFFDRRSTMRHTPADETRSFRFSARRFLTDLGFTKAGLSPEWRSRICCWAMACVRMARDWLPDTRTLDRRGTGSAG